MSRLNLTLDFDTSDALSRHARRQRKPRATVARALLREAIARREAVERQQQLARDYAAGGSDARATLLDFEAPQLDLLEDDDVA
jgi:hypothetical protein